MTPLLLKGDDADQYCDAVCAAIKAARLNKTFPDASAAANQIRLMAPRVHRGLYESIEIDAFGGGLPSYKMWTRVQADITVAKSELQRIGQRDRLASRSETDIVARQLAKHDYYREIQEQTAAFIGDVEVKVRRLEEDRGTFHVVLDKLDLNGVYLRYAIDLAQHGYSRVIDVRQDDELAEQTEELRALVYKFAAVTSEHTFGKLQTLGGVEVERVNKGTIGPFFFGWSKNIPELLRPVIDAGHWVATFTTDSAATDIIDDKWNDPLEKEPTDRSVRERFGFGCFKDRKFVTSRIALPLLREVLSKTDSRNIVYAIR